MKTKGIYGKELVITQTAHGTQSGKAIDSSSPLIANEDVYVYNYQHITQWHGLAKCNTEQESYFYVRMFNSNDYFIVVHAYPMKTGLIKAGEEVGRYFPYWSWKDGSRSDHFHTCARIGKEWVEPPCVLDREVKLKWPWGDHWSTKYENYRDLSINTIIPINETNMATLDFSYKCYLKGTPALLRRTPDRKFEPLRVIDTNIEFETNKISDGEIVDGNSRWYFYDGGWLSGSLLNIINPKLEELDVAKKTISEKIIEIDKLTGRILEMEWKINDYNAKIDELSLQIKEKDEKITQLTLGQAQDWLKNIFNNFLKWIKIRKG